jgi:DNA-binding NarL/FixJ family response regulator
MTADPSIRVLIADDHLLFAEALAGALSLQERIEVVGIAANGREAVHLSGLLQPDVILMDLQMPLMGGVEATRMIVGGDLPPPRILVLTGSDNGDEVKAAREAGASGYLTKDRSTVELREALTSLVSLAAALNPTDGALGPTD